MGVAILARGKKPIETGVACLVIRMTPIAVLSAAIEGMVSGCLYLPNGNPAPGPEFDYKLRWFKDLAEYADSLLALDLPVVLAGDYSVMPTELDVYKTERWLDDALFRPEVRGAFHALTAQGWTDALRSLYPDEKIYTFWDYFPDAWGRNAGLRLDHFLLSPVIATRLVAADVDARCADGKKQATMHLYGSNCVMVGIRRRSVGFAANRPRNGLAVERHREPWSRS